MRSKSIGEHCGLLCSLVVLSIRYVFSILVQKLSLKSINQIYHVHLVTMNYLEYGVSIKDKIVTTSDEFPVITICLNSMHSRRKVDGNYLKF